MPTAPPRQQFGTPRPRHHGVGLGLRGGAGAALLITGDTGVEDSDEQVPWRCSWGRD